MRETGAIWFCSGEDLDTHAYVTRWVEELVDEITVFRARGTLVARSSVCPHFAGPLAPDERRDRLRCAWHGWEFDLTTGACLTHSLAGCVRPYRAVERDGRIEIETGDEDR